MADVPTTLLVKTTDPVEFPLESLMVVMSSIFKFRVKEVVRKENMVAVSLFYSPKSSTLRRKFGTLPVSYVRVNVKNDRELQLFEEAARMYRFDLHDSDVEDETLALQSSSASSTQKRLQLHPEGGEPAKRKKVNTTASTIEDDLNDVKTLQKAAAIDLDETGLREFVEDFDPNNEYEGQIY